MPSLVVFEKKQQPFGHYQIVWYWRDIFVFNEHIRLL